MKSSRLFLILILLILGVITIYRVLLPQDTNVIDTPESKQVDKPTVITTLFPFYDLSRQILGEEAEISLLLPSGVEPHTFEPTPQDIIKIKNADVFIYTGDIMEPWVAKILTDIPASVNIIDASKDIKLIESSDAHGHDDDKKENKSDSQLDPHFWLDFNNTIIATNNIYKTIANLNIVNNINLDQDTNNLIQALEQLDADYKNTLSQCSNKTILQAGHRTFEYLAKRYNLTYITTDELSPNSDTSATNIAKLIQEVRKNKAKAIFSEELVEPRIANTIATETGVPVLQLNGAHNISAQQFQEQLSFIDIMRQNLDNLTIGLDCK